MISSEERKCRVLMLSTSYPLYKGAVSGVFVKYLVNTLSQHNVVEVLTPDDHINSPIELSDTNIFRFRYGPKRCQRLAHLPGGISAQLRKHKYFILLVPIFLLSYFLFHLCHPSEQK